MDRIGGALTPVDEVHGFRYFDDRDLIGFVDGTENPRGDEALAAVRWVMRIRGSRTAAT
jgi:putative iron-dependent peroxidase